MYIHTGIYIEQGFRTVMLPTAVGKQYDFGSVKMLKTTDRVEMSRRTTLLCIRLQFLTLRNPSGFSKQQI